MSKEKMRIDVNEHIKHNWLSDKFLIDFEVEDVWLLPIKLDDHHSLHDVLNQFVITMESISGKGLAGFLFKFRLVLGKIFKWEKDKSQIKERPGPIRRRYLKEEKYPTDNLSLERIGSFKPVYFFENEYLLELENKIVQACLHLSKIPTTDKKYQVHMAVYVKPKGYFGHFYMLLIKPFRLLIVYPSILNVFKLEWNKFLQSTGKNI